MYYLILLFLSSYGFSDDTFQEVIERGIKLYKNQEYERALKVFEDAEKINPNSDLVNLELAMTYYELESYRKSYIYSKKVIESGNTELRAQSYVVMGNSMFKRNNKKDAVKTLEDAIIELSDNDILYYCLGNLLYELKKYDESIINLKKAIKYNYLNADFHYLLSCAFYMNSMSKDDILSSLYYLLLEPNDKRSLRIILFLKNSLISNNLKDKYIEEYGDENLVKQNSLLSTVLNKLMVLNVEIDNYNAVMDEFLKNNGEMTELEFVHFEIKRIVNTTALDNKYLSDISSEFYLPFFISLSKSNHLETFCHYISFNISEESAEWLNKNPDKVKSFMLWIRGN